MHTKLHQSGRITTTAISGIRGVGKTELAIQYALAHQQDYQGGICWISARLAKLDASRTDLDASNTRIDASRTNDASNVATQIVEFAKTYLGLNPPDDIKNLSVQTQWCWQNWCNGNVLLILDDVNDYAQIQPYLPPPNPRFQVLITTWLTILKSSVRLELEVLTPPHAVALLESLVSSQRVQAELSVAAKLCQWVGHLPLGLELLGCYLERKQDLSLAEMLQRLQLKGLKQQALIQPQSQSGMTALWGVSSAFDLVWQDLSGLAKEVGCFLSIFDVIPIQWILVEQSFDEQELEALEQARDDFLLNFHLLQREGQGIYKLHELVREFFQTKLPELDNVENLQKAVTLRVAAIASHHALLLAEILKQNLLNWQWVTSAAQLPAREWGWQIHTATQAWATGIGPLASIALPLRDDGTVPNLGVRLSQNDRDKRFTPVSYVQTGWNFSPTSTLERVVELPSEIENVFGEDKAARESEWLKLSAAGWNYLKSAPFDQQASWAWKRTFHTIVSSLTERLKTRSLSIEAGYLSLEAAWHAALCLTKGNYPHFYSHPTFDPILLDEIDSHLANISNSRFSSMMQHCLNQLRIEVNAAHNRGETYLSLPASIQNFKNHRGCADFVLPYVAGIYEGAVKGYEQLINAWFPALVPRMELAATLPAQIVGVVVPSAGTINVTWFWEPLPEGSQSGVDFCQSDTIPPPGNPRYQAALQQIRFLRPNGLRHLRMQSSTAPFIMPWQRDCPATELAYQWLWEDLKRISWVEGDLGHAGHPYWR